MVWARPALATRFRAKALASWISFSLAPRSAVADVENLTMVQPSTYEEYQQRKRMGRVTVESFRDGYVYFATEDSRDVPLTPSEGEAASARVSVTERYRARIPAAK